MSVETLKSEYLNLPEEEQLEFIAFILSVQKETHLGLSKEDKTELLRRAKEIKQGLSIAKSGKIIEERIMQKYGIRL